MNQTATSSAAANTGKSSNAATTSVAALAAASSSIVIYFSTHNTIMVGYDNVPQPRHITELPSTTNTTALTMPRSLKDAEVIFQYYSSSIERLIHLLGGASPNAAASTNSSGSNSSSRRFKNRYIVLHDFGIYLNRYWKLAIMRILYDVCNATYLKFLSTIEMIPFSVVSPSMMTLTDDVKGSTSSTSTSVVLSIHISGNAAQCMIYANGHHLEYTYQSCEYCDSEDGNDDALEMVDDLRKRQEQWLLSATSPLIYAIALCLEKCPVSIRKDVVQNIYFSGTILVHAFQERAVLLLYEFITGDTSHSYTNTSVEPTATTTTSDVNDQVTTRTSPNTTMLVQLTQIPINRTMLRPLAPYIAIIEHNNKDNGSDFSMNSTSRTTELIPWLGVTTYSSYWHYHEQHQDMISSSRISPSANEAQHDGMNWIDVTTTLTDPWKKRD